MTLKEKVKGWQSKQLVPDHFNKEIMSLESLFILVDDVLKIDPEKLNFVEGSHLQFMNVGLEKQYRYADNWTDGFGNYQEEITKVYFWGYNFIHVAAKRLYTAINYTKEMDESLYDFGKMFVLKKENKQQDDDEVYYERRYVVQLPFQYKECLRRIYDVKPLKQDSCSVSNLLVEKYAVNMYTGEHRSM